VIILVTIHKNIGLSMSEETRQTKDILLQTNKDKLLLLERMNTTIHPNLVKE
jgi:hypothetical protein